MLKEYKALRDQIRVAVPNPVMRRSVLLKVGKALRAMREDCAKVADVHAKHFADFAERAKKKGHNVDDIVARRIASEDIATEIRGRTPSAGGRG